MSPPLLVAICFLWAIATALYVLVKSRYLLAFFYLCHSLPFFGLAPVIFGDEAVFWTGTAFNFEAYSMEVHAISLIWVVSTMGIFASCLLFFANNRISARDSKYRAMNIGNPTQLPSSGALGTVALGFAAVLVALRFIYLDLLLVLVPGYDSIICISIVFCWALVLVSPNSKIEIVNYVILMCYVISCILTADRDFFGLLITYLIFWMIRRNISLTQLFFSIFIGIFLVAFGIYISMARLDVALSLEDLSIFLRFNSWNAAILPVIQMVSQEWRNGPLLLGQTYLDLFLSLPPSPIFNVLGLDKPINTNNPAFWFYVEGLGGMHEVGVALRNFGLTGVAVQSFIFAYLLLAAERMVVDRRTVISYFLFFVISLNLMHATWYGLVYMTNSIFFVFILYCVVWTTTNPHLRTKSNSR